ncbi:MAG: NUMOD4 domain-containing protein [bacterium]|nr:NUMOD4 domain-containing protein [bacterium]
MSTLEIWKSVVGHAGEYEVSNLGRVRSLDREWPQVSRSGAVYTHHKRGRVLRPGRATAGHLTVALGRGNSRLVHHLVLEAFVGPCPAGHECRHLNGQEDCNALSNLKWDTRGNNTRDKKWHRGCSRYILTPPQIVEIKRAQQRPYVGQGRALAARYGVHESTISCVKLGKIHIDVNI